jgi:hypothetical protein
MKMRKSGGRRLLEKEPQKEVQKEKSVEVLSDEDQLKVIGGTGDELIVWPHAIGME